MDAPPRYVPRSHHDVDTISIRSAAPSYISAAPSYHSLHNHGSIPMPRRTTAPPINRGREPSLDDFRHNAWSSTRAHPNARLYHSVAHRRATIAAAQDHQQLLTAAACPRAALQLLQQKAAEVELRLGALEDPVLVGEQAAEEARRERLRREGRLGDEILIREDKRWDWLLSQMRDWESRETSWNAFRKDLDAGKKGKLARRLGLKR